MRDTAVQWYHKQIGFLFQQWHNHQITISEFHFKRLELQHQAKEIEKEQIINAVDEGISQGYGKYIDTEWGRENDWKAEQYYNETYGGNK
jgi:hypothetical protein